MEDPAAPAAGAAAVEPAAAEEKPADAEDPIGAPLSLQAGSSQLTDGALEREAAAMANSVTMAKGSRYFDGLQCRVTKSGRMSSEGYSFMLNEAARFAAAHSTASRAEKHLSKLDSRKGYEPEVATVNALLGGIGRKGDLKRAEMWFARLQEPLLHPELGGMAPNKGTYDVMVQIAAQADDVRRVQKFLDTMRKMYKPARASYLLSAEAFMRANEIKRAHHTLEALVREGCDQIENYGAGVMKEQLQKLKSQRAWDPIEIVALIKLVVRRLADTGNTVTAQRWLEYLTDCGFKAEDRELSVVWERVRDALPKEIMPALLYSESDMTPARGEPMVELPSPVCGEDPPLRPPIKLPPPMVQAKEDPKQQPEMSSLDLAVACAHGSKPGTLPQQDSQGHVRSTWGGAYTPRTAEGRILAANLNRRAQKKVAGSMVLASPRC